MNFSQPNESQVLYTVKAISTKNIPEP